MASNSISRGILGWGSYLPYRRLDRSTIAGVAGAGGGKGTRTVASFDEDTTTLGVESARQVLRALPDVTPGTLWFATTEPAYLDKSNSSAVHAALRLPRSVAAYDLIGSVRSALGALRAGLHAYGPALVVTADIRTGLPGGPDEAGGGDGAVSVVTGTSEDGPLAAEVLAWGSATEDVLDRWRTPGDNRSKLWEERFGETRYVPLAVEAWETALKQAGVAADDIAAVAVTGTNDRVTTAVTRKLGVADKRIDPLVGVVGNTGAASPLLMLASALETAAPGSLVALVGVDGGADAVIFRVTDAAAQARPARSVADQIALGGAVTVRPLPGLARLPAGRAAAPSRARPRLRFRRRPVAGLEIRLRRIRAFRRIGASAAVRFRRVAEADGRGDRHGRDLHARPVVVLPEPAGDLCGRRLRRRRSAADRAHRSGCEGRRDR